MKKLLALAALSAVLASGAVIAKSSKEVSPYGLGDRSLFSERATAERLKPVGTVCVQGAECGSAAGLVADAAADVPRSGGDVYNTVCMACHTTGAAGAPKIGDKAAWAPRIAKGYDTLVEHTIKGFNAMPPAGMCMNCSEDELRAALDYLIEQ